MTDMSNKFSCIVRNKEGVIIDAVNIIGDGYCEVEKVAKEKEKETGNIYVIIKDSYLFNAIQIWQDRYINAVSKLLEVRDNINDFINEDVVGDKDV